jgi:hypothetical protein
MQVNLPRPKQVVVSEETIQSFSLVSYDNLKTKPTNFKNRFLWSPISTRTLIKTSAGVALALVAIRTLPKAEATPDASSTAMMAYNPENPQCRADLTNIGLTCGLAILEAIIAGRSPTVALKILRDFIAKIAACLLSVRAACNDQCLPDIWCIPV